jgi:hypothetical protein
MSSDTDSAFDIPLKDQSDSNKKTSDAASRISAARRGMQTRRNNARLKSAASAATRISAARRGMQGRRTASATRKFRQQPKDPMVCSIEKYGNANMLNLWWLESCIKSKLIKKIIMPATVNGQGGTPTIVDTIITQAKSQFNIEFPYASNAINGALNIMFDAIKDKLTEIINEAKNYGCTVIFDGKGDITMTSQALALRRGASGRVPLPSMQITCIFNPIPNASKAQTSGREAIFQLPLYLTNLDKGSQNCVKIYYDICSTKYGRPKRAFTYAPGINKYCTVPPQDVIAAMPHVSLDSGTIPVDQKVENEAQRSQAAMAPDVSARSEGSSIPSTPSASSQSSFSSESSGRGGRKSRKRRKARKTRKGRNAKKARKSRKH